MFLKILQHLDQFNLKLSEQEIINTIRIISNPQNIKEAVSHENTAQWQHVKIKK